MNKIQQEDIQQFVHSFALADELQNTTFLITGATGLIGSSLVHCLLALNKNIRIVAPVRNRAKAEAMFEYNANQIEWIECDLAKYDYSQTKNVDYIVHCAAPTTSSFFVEHPVETIDIIYRGTYNLLEFARKKICKGFVYLSSLEVYGSELSEQKISENIQGYWDTMNVRSSYPIAKRAVENLCCAYAAEYDIPICVARLTQTTGAGIAKDDNRVIAQFARLAAHEEDIVLHTTGESARPYCYTIDCVSAILYILLRGVKGEAYNVANEDTYISARDMAKFLCDNVNPKIAVHIELKGNMGYAPTSKLNLSTSKLRALGWRPQYGLKEIFKRLIKYLSDETQLANKD